MRRVVLCTALCVPLFFSLYATVQAQIDKSSFRYSASPENPYGAYNPAAPPELNDFSPMIGSSQCKSVQRNPDGTWPDTTNMIWEFRYIFNGMAIQDINWKMDGGHSSSIRQFNPDSSRWVVTYFSARTASFSPSTWTGNRSGSEIILTRPRKAANGMEGESRLTFYDISESGFSWIGEWISEDGSIVYPFWKISCVKRE